MKGARFVAQNLSLKSLFFSGPSSPTAHAVQWAATTGMGSVSHTEARE